MQYLAIAGSSAAVYVFLVAAIRLFGKKELAQLSILDLVFILLISNAVQNAMVGSDTSLMGGLCAAGTLFVVNFLFKLALYRFPKLSGLLQGMAILLVYHGEVQRENLKRARMSLFELEEAAREHGVASLIAVDLAVLEVDGNISILTDDFKKRSHRGRGKDASSSS